MATRDPFYVAPAAVRACKRSKGVVAVKAAGYKPGDPPPFYRTWCSRKNTLLVNLYKER